jgi:integrative and conjugative element protein (TIGR02256 family)
MQPEESIKPRYFGLPDSNQRLVLMPHALQVFTRYRQAKDEPEAGGLLFAEFNFPLIRIVEVTSPDISDQRWRTLFIPNRTLQRKRIRQIFALGQHFVGEWHTHPEPNPTPSQFDLKSMSDAFRKSSHELNHFLMIIVGNRTDCLQLWVSAHDKFDCCQLPELSAEVGRLDAFA